MPTIRNCTMPHDLAAGLTSTVDMLDRLRVFVRDDQTRAEIDRRVTGAALMLLGAPYFQRDRAPENVEMILREIEAAERQPVRRASR